MLGRRTKGAIMHTRHGILLATLGIIALAPGLVLAKGKHAAAAPSATVRVEAKEVAAGVGWAWGDGVLNYRGKRHPFKISGLTAVGVGASRQDATGVRITRHSASQGVAAQAGPEGMKITLEH